MYLSIKVEGTPKTAGSKRGFPVRRRDGSRGVAIVDDSGKPGKWWRSSVQFTAADRMRRAGLKPFDEPLAIVVVFRTTRPRSHFRKSGELKPSAPRFPDRRPDATKLLRSVEDALTRIVWRDDASIVVQVVGKIYADCPGVDIHVGTIGDPEIAREIGSVRRAYDL